MSDLDNLIREKFGSVVGSHAAVFERDNHTISPEAYHILQLAAEKYFRLVWWARSDSNRPDIVALRQKVESDYPDDTQRVMNDDENFEHGFNSGVLAGIRLALGLSKVDKEENKENEEDSEDEFDEVRAAVEDFPHLDT